MSDEIQETGGKERHPFRFLFKLAFFAGLIYLVSRFVAEKKDEYMGLTETEARTKFMEMMGPRVGEENAAEIADQVIPKLKERGLLKSDSDDSRSDSDQVDEAVDSEVKD